MQKSVLLCFSLLLLVMACALRLEGPLVHEGTEVYFKPDRKPFYHGVASGDPLQDAVIIWTRVTPPVEDTVAVEWVMARDEDFQQVVGSGTTFTQAQRDYTVKVDVKGLEAGSVYYYKFRALGGESTVGRTKTLPRETAEVKLAVVSCSNFEAGYFNAFLRIAQRPDLDAVLHLGDYFYEYEPRRYGDASTGRFHLPPREIVDLEDYRTRYAQYRLDPDFQAIHQRLPFFTIWDDHEIANNSFIRGAQNHQWLKEGSYKKRRAAATRSYFEWMPVRESGDDRLYRRFSFGNLVEIFMLDERLAGRTEPPTGAFAPDYYDEERTMLGQEQLDWLTTNLKNSQARWKVIGNQVIFSDFNRDSLWTSNPKNMDAWDGYPREKRKIMDFLLNQKVENVIFVSGDTHSSWAFEVCRSAIHYNKNQGASYAVEFGTPSVTSGNMGDTNPLDSVLAREQKYLQPTINPHLKYVNLSSKGYLLLTLSANETLAEWYYMDKVNEPSGVEIPGPAFRVRSGTNKLEQVRNFDRKVTALPKKMK